MLEAARIRLERSAGLEPGDLDRLRRSTVGVIGAGVVGGGLIRHLALLGIGQVVVDPDVVGPENLANQGFPVDGIGHPKSRVRARQMREVAPHCRVRPIVARLEDLGLAALRGVDMVCCAVDSRSTRIRLSEVCTRLATPWVDAAVDGSGRWLIGAVTLFDPRRPESPCYGCDLDAAALSEIAAEGRGPGCPSWARPGTPSEAPTLQGSAFAAGMIAGLQALAAIRILLGRAGVPAGTQWVVDCDAAPGIRTLRLGRSPRCLFDHRPFTPLRDAPGDTVGALLEQAAHDLGRECSGILLHHRALVLNLECGACGRITPLSRVAETLTEADLRCPCREGATLRPVRLTEFLRPSEARLLRAMRWSELGLPPREVVSACAPGRAVHYVVRSGCAEQRLGSAEIRP